MQPLVLILVLLVVGSVAYFSYYLRKKRRDETAALAARLGLTYSAADTFAIDETMPHRLFSLGDGRGCENVMWGTWNEMPVTEFDYWYYDESTDSDGQTTRTTHRFSCAMTYVNAGCPPLIISKENLFTRLADGLGFRDIEFETDEFNRAWQVKCPDRKFANDFIDQRMMQWLMHAGPSWSFEVVGRIALVYSGKLSIPEIPTLLACLRAFRDKIPRVVEDLYPLPAPAPGFPGARPETS